MKILNFMPWMGTTCLVILFHPSPGFDAQKTQKGYESYIQTFKVKDEKGKETNKKLRCLFLPYDSKGRVPVIEDFASHCDVFQVGGRAQKETLNKDVHFYNIMWPANFTDGSLCLSIMPNFIYLRTNHNNPNYDDFLWYGYLNDTQYRAAVKFFKNGVKDGSLAVLDKKDAFTAWWEPYFKENDSINYSTEEGPEPDKWPFPDHYMKALYDRDNLYQTLSGHYVAANMDYLFWSINCNLVSPKNLLHFPDWIHYSKESLSLIYGTYLEDAIEGGMMPGTRNAGVYADVYGSHFDTTGPITVTVDNHQSEDVAVAVEVDFMRGDKPSGSFVTIGRTNLPKNATHEFLWSPADLPLGEEKGGEWNARIKVTYGKDESALLKDPRNVNSSFFTLGYPKTFDDIWGLENHREALTDLYYRSKSKVTKNGLSSLGPAETLLIDLWDFMGDFASTPQAHTLYFVEKGDRVLPTVAALHAIGADCFADALQKSISYFPGDVVPVDKKQRETIVKGWDDQKNEDLGKLADSVWAKYNGDKNAVCREGLDELLYQYLLKHRMEFKDSK